MLERSLLPSIHKTLFKIMGIPHSQSLTTLDHRLAEIEENIKVWLQKVEARSKPEIVHKRVLLLDTDTSSYESLREVIPNPFELKMIKSWDQLFREVRKAEVPLVLLDLALLGQEGAQNIRKLNEAKPETRVVVLANYLSETLAQAMPDGINFSGILQKPLDRTLLKENLEKYIS
jgi:response regulator RpfG family c-di-GMP phosphodiesterase